VAQTGDKANSNIRSEARARENVVFMVLVMPFVQIPREGLKLQKLFC